MQAGFGRFHGAPVAVLGQEKGSSTETRLKHNFGMAKPEGYRKAVRIMDMADRFNIPVLSFVDTAGAYPGIGAEERGQAEAIARCTEKCLELGVPNLAIIIGEGGSGGAIAIATANRVLMLENAIYAVASPEASASILWKDAARAQDAANNMKITAQDLLGFGVIDGIIPEPAGGAHRHPEAVMTATGDADRGFPPRFPRPARQARSARAAARKIHGDRQRAELRRSPLHPLCPASPSSAPLLRCGEGTGAPLEGAGTARRPGFPAKAPLCVARR